MIDEINIPTKEIEADGFITPPSALEQTNLNRAKPISECAYPKCEECDKYHGHYCTVPMVVSKQIWRITEQRLNKLEGIVAYLDEVIAEKVLGL